MKTPLPRRAGERSFAMRSVLPRLARELIRNADQLSSAVREYSTDWGRHRRDVRAYFAAEPKGLTGLILTPGPMVELTVTLFIYWPLATEGLAFSRVSMTVL